MTDQLAHKIKRLHKDVTYAMNSFVMGGFFVVVFMLKCEVILRKGLCNFTISAVRLKQRETTGIVGNSERGFD